MGEQDTSGPGGEDAEAVREMRALRQELKCLREEVHRLSRSALLRENASWWTVGLASLWRGLAWGLGSALGASLLLAIVIRILSSFDFIPILGDVARQVIDAVQQPPPH